MSVLLLAQFSDLVAQAQHIIPGTRVRILAPTAATGTSRPQLVLTGGEIRSVAPTIAANGFIGTIIAFDADTLKIKIAKRAFPLAVPIRAVETFEVSRGRRSMIGQGTLLGLVLGTGIGFLTASSQANNSQRAEPEDFYYKTVLPAFALFGAGIGALIGAVTKEERWEKVPLEQVRFGLSPRREVLTLSVSFRF